MAQAKLQNLSTLRLSRVTAAILLLWAALAHGATCDYPSTAITNGNPVYSYNITIAPVVAGTVKVEYFTSLACNPYATYVWDALKGPYTLSALRGSPVYVRITVTADPNVQPAVPPNSATVYLNPPNAPVTVLPAAPTGFKVT